MRFLTGVNHTTSCGNERKALFKDDQNRVNALNTLQHDKNGINSSILPVV